MTEKPQFQFYWSLIFPTSSGVFAKADQFKVKKLKKKKKMNNYKKRINKQEKKSRIEQNVCRNHIISANAGKWRKQEMCFRTDFPK